MTFQVIVNPFILLKGIALNKYSTSIGVGIGGWGGSTEAKQRGAKSSNSNKRTVTTHFVTFCKLIAPYLNEQ